MSLSRLAREIHESPTLKLNQQANALRKEGQPVIHLGGGEPESMVPLSATEAAVETVRTRSIRYTAASGTPEMRQAVVEYTRTHYGHHVTPANVIISHGAKQALYCAFMAVIDPGEEVIFPCPYWVSYPDMIRMVGGVPVPVLPAGNPFYPSLDDLAAKVTDRTKAILINSPNNPSGAVYDADFIASVVRFCEDRGLYLITDDIYHRLLFDDRSFTSPFACARVKGDDSRLIVVNGVSKQYAMTGYRIGWAVGAKPVIEVMGRLQGHQTSGPSIVCQKASMAAIYGPQEDVDSLRRDLRQKRDAMVEAVGTIPGVQLQPPDGTFYGFADFSAWDSDSSRLAKWLLERVQVVTVPGVEFGLEGYLRLSFCGAAEDIVDGIARIRWAFDADAGDTLEQRGYTFTRDWPDQPRRSTPLAAGAGGRSR